MKARDEVGVGRPIDSSSTFLLMMNMSDDDFTLALANVLPFTRQYFRINLLDRSGFVIETWQFMVNQEGVCGSEIAPHDRGHKPVRN